MRRLLLSVSIAIVCASNADLCAQIEESSKAVIEWNQTILNLAEQEDGFMTLKGLRTVTMIHLAMHDAVNTVEQGYSLYLDGRLPVKANGFVAINQAAFVIGSQSYPDHKNALKELRDKWVENAEHSNDMKTSLQLGEDVAWGILKSRDGDGWNAEAEYQWHPMGPGVYAEFNEHSGTPDGFIFGAGWGAAKPFALVTNDQFVSPPPPEIASEAYARAFNEVKLLGAYQSEARTGDQSHLALWWKDFVENSHNRLARTLAEKEKLEFKETIRLFALLNMSIYDAYISSFYNKFLYNHWRPYTAIRWASNDTNPATKEDSSWTNTHLHTYAFPSYPSAHGTACSAATTVLASVFGDTYSYSMYTKLVDRAGPFSGKIKLDPPVRSFWSFHEAALECAFSRVYLGIHFSYDSLEGLELGRRVGRHVVENLLTPH